MREGLKEDRCNLRMPPPVPLVPRHLRLGVASAWMGKARCVCRSIRPARCRDRPAGDGGRRGRGNLLPAQLPQSEPRADRGRRGPRGPARRLRFRVHEVYPQIKEYERTSTTIINAYVGPAPTYLQSLD